MAKQSNDHYKKKADMSGYLNTETETLAAGSRLTCFSRIYRLHHKTRINRWLWGILALLVIISCLPWTQNIRARGNITTLRQEQRPQQVNTIIAGTAIKW
jgi:hypothetical protein